MWTRNTYRCCLGTLRPILALCLALVLALPVSIMALQSVVPEWSRIHEREARLELARLLSLNQDHLPEAEQQYLSLFEDDPGDPHVFLGLLSVFVQMREHRKASDLVRGFSLARLEAPEQQLEFAGLSSALGHARTARVMALDLLERHPGDLSMRLRLANMMLAWGDFYRSEAVIHDILAQPGGDAHVQRAALLELSRNFMAAQRYEQAEGVLQGLLLRDPQDHAARLALVQLHIEEKDYRGALRMLSSSALFDLDDPAIQRLQARVLFLSGDLEAALTIQEHICAAYGNHPEDGLAQAKTLLRLERESRAARVLESVLERDPDNIEAGFLWAALMPSMSAARADPTVQGDESSLRLPVSPQVLRYSPVGLRQRIDPKADHPTDGQASRKRGPGQGRIVNNVVMQPEFLVALRQDARSPHQLARWGELFARAGVHAQAMACYEAALELDPEHFPARLGLAEASASNRDYQRSLNILEALLLEMPDTSKLLLTQARVLSWAQRYEDAMAAYEVLHLLRPEDPIPLREAARVAMWSKQADRAKRLYQSMQASKDLRGMIPEVGALRCLTHEPETLAALAQLEQDLRAGRVHPVFERLEETFIKHRGEFQPDLVERMDRLLVELRPTHRIQKAAYLEERVKMLAWERRYMPALDAYEELLESQSGNQEALFDLAQAQCILGLHDQELATCERLLKIDPLHGRAGMAVERITRRSRLGLHAGYGYWNEQSQGGSRLSAMERHHGELALELPLQTARYHLIAAQHFWTERPKSLADAREDFAGSYAAQGQTMGLRGVFSPWLRGNFSFTRKEYSKALLGKRDLGQAGLEVNLWDYARLGLEYERMEELANGFSLRQKVMSHVWRAKASSSLTRRLDLGLMSEFREMNDDNQAWSVRGDLGYLVTDHPRELKITLSGEHRDFQKKSSYTYLGANLEDITHPYWTPQNYYSGTVGLQWRHDLAEFFFCGAGRHVYSLKLSVGTDSDDNPGVRMEGAYHFDFAKQWSLIAQGLIHRSRQWDAEGLWLGVGYRF